MLFGGRISRQQRQEFRAQADRCLGPAYDKIAELEARLEVLSSYVEEQEEMILKRVVGTVLPVWKRIWNEVRRGPERRRAQGKDASRKR